MEREKIIREMQLIRGDLRTVMGFLDCVHISKKFIEGNIRTIKRIEEVQNYKLAELFDSKLHDPKKVIHNYCSYDLSKAEISLLLKGPNFSLPSKKLKFESHLLPFELLYRDVSHDENDINDSLIHLKSKIKDVGLSSLRLFSLFAICWYLTLDQIKNFSHRLLSCTCFLYANISLNKIYYIE